MHEPNSSFDRCECGSPDRYGLSAAAADLTAAGLWQYALVARDGLWRRVSLEELEGCFLGAVLDSRQARTGQLFVGLPGPRVDGSTFAVDALKAGSHALVGPVAELAGLPGEKSDPVPPGGVILVCADAQAGLAFLAGSWRRKMPALVVGITGSNGKTTTKDLLAAILSAAGRVHATTGNLNSAQGVPLVLLGLLPGHRYAVVEMGATAPGHIADRAALAHPTIGIITNAAEAHLAEFGNLQRIITGKGELVASLPSTGRAVLNADSPGFDHWVGISACPVISWGRRTGDHRWDWVPSADGAGGRLILDEETWSVPLPGRHNGANLCAAILAGRAAGLSDAQIRAGLLAFRASPHRASLRRLQGRYVLDDCYNANPESMLSAARMLCDLPGAEAWVVLGGMAELGRQSEDLHRAVGRDLAALGIDHLVVVGDAAVPLAEGYGQHKRPAVICADQSAAAALLDERTRPSDRILVKGSRSTAMERVIELLIESHGWTEVGS